jgi:secretion/DNA translocation related CpaE-like protein
MPTRSEPRSRDRPVDPSRESRRTGPTAPPLLLVTRDGALADHVAALADAAGARLRVRPAVESAAVRESSLVLLGVDADEPLPPGCPGSVLVARVEGGDPPEGIWRQALELGVDNVAVLPEAESWLLGRFADAASPAPLAPVVAVIGGRGGAGASTIAIALAATAARAGRRPMLIDLDPLGGGLDLPLGSEGVEGLRWPDLPRERPAPGFLAAALPDVGGIRVLSCGREPTTPAADQVSAVIEAAVRDAELVVVDLPRRVSSAEQVALAAARAVLLVVPAEVRATAAAAQLAATLETYAADVRLVVRGPAPTGLTAEAVADAVALPLAGELRPEAGLAAATDRGEAAALRPRGPLGLLCRHVLADLLAPS